jgi:alkylhydroperoxidase family enzyme
MLFVERMTRGAAAMREPSVQELRQHFSDDQIVALALVVCVANFTNRFNDALQVEPDLG